MSGELKRQRAKLQAIFADFEADPANDSLLIFVDNNLDYLGSTGWTATSNWPVEMARMHAAGATGFFVALRRTTITRPDELGGLDQVALTGEHAGLSLIDVLRWKN